MSFEVVIIGAVAAGPKAGCRIKRLRPDAHVVMLDKDDFVSYGGCGIPFYVSGDVGELKGLLSTSYHMVRDIGFFKNVKGIDVQNATEAIFVDRKAKKVRTRPAAGGPERELSYDKLVLATGSIPVIPPVPGVELAGVFPVADLHQAQAIKKMVSQGQVEHAAIVGAGAIGLEMAEALSDLWGIEVHLFDQAPQLLPGLLDVDFARMLEAHLAQKEEIHLHLNAPLQAILDDGQGRVRAVKAADQEYPADLVIMACGVRPNAALAKAAGLRLWENGAIWVDEFMQTSDADIYAGGDCVSLPGLFTDKPMYLASGSLANRQGRVIGTNLCGGREAFPRPVGSFCLKLFGLSVARAGLNPDQAAKAGLKAIAPMVVQADRAHFHPDHKLMYLKLLVEEKTRRVLGITALGENGDAVAGRVNAIAGMMPLGARLEDVANLELCYSPPLGAAMDILNTAANAAENMLAGRLRPLGFEEFRRRLAEREDGKTVFVDVRSNQNVAPYLAHLAPHWMHLPQDDLAKRLGEVPRNKDVILVCNTGGRSYEAQVVLDAAGIKNTRNLGGGVAAIHKWGEPILPAPPDEE